MNDDFDMFHNILYYIYYDYISFSKPGLTDCKSSDTPKVCDVVDLYTIAHRLMLDNLQRKATEFVRANWSFNMFLLYIIGFERSQDTNTAAQELFESYCSTNWNHIKVSESFRSLLEKDEDDEELTYFTQWFGKMMLTTQLNSWRFENPENEEITLRVLARRSHWQ
jgi:hypothetical protein